MEDFRDIRVKVRKNRKSGQPKLKIKNSTSYKLIGQGGQGAVFQLSSKRCVKIYPDRTPAESEQAAMKAGQEKPFMPALYETGDRYTVMEYVKGEKLKKYLKKHVEKKDRFPKWLANQIIQVLRDMREVGFNRVDMRIRHVFVVKDRQLKVVDHVNAYRHTEVDKPTLLLTDLKKEKWLKPFLKRVKKIDKTLYQKWKE